MIGVLGFDSQLGLGIFLFTTASRPVLGPTQPPIQWVPRALSLVLKRLGRDADHSTPSSAEVKKCVELNLHSHNTSSWRGAQLSTGTTLSFTFIYNNHFSNFFSIIQFNNCFQLIILLYVSIDVYGCETGQSPTDDLYRQSCVEHIWTKDVRINRRMA
jgi:hypothetical protein